MGGRFALEGHDGPTAYHLEKQTYQEQYFRCLFGEQEMQRASRGLFPFIRRLEFSRLKVTVIQLRPQQSAVDSSHNEPRVLALS